MNNNAIETDQTDVNGCSHIYKLRSEEVVFIIKHDHYKLRGDLLEYLCLHEYCGMIKVVKKPRPPTVSTADGGRWGSQAAKFCIDFHPTQKFLRLTISSFVPNYSSQL